MSSCWAHTIEVRRPHKGNVNTEVTVVGGAVEAQVDAKGNGRPGRVLLSAVEADLESQWARVSFRDPEEIIAIVVAHLVRWLRLQLLKDLERLLLGREGAHRGGRCWRLDAIPTTPSDFPGDRCLVSARLCSDRVKRGMRDRGTIRGNVGIIIKETLLQALAMR